MALLFGCAAVLLRRRRAAVAHGNAFEDVLPAPLPEAPAPAPLPAAPLPLPAPAVAEARPRIDLVFTPLRAAITETEIEIDYQLVVRNAGEAPASRLRLDILLVNAGRGHEAELDSLFQGRDRSLSAPAPRPLPPGARFEVVSKVVMPRPKVHEIVVEGRRMVVPIVAFSTSYHWNGGSGRSSAAFVVGRETNPPGARMGPFRLDLGPRVYRSVGQRTDRPLRHD
jgi:hypothetical protein